MVLGLGNSLSAGATGPSTEDSKALVLCRERKHLVRQILDGRCALAEAHEAYIHSLKNTGIAIRKLVAAEPLAEPSLCNSQPLLSTAESSRRFHAAHMKSNGAISKIIEERPPQEQTATVLSASDESPKADVSDNRGWDYFGIFHPTHDRLLVEDASKSEEQLPELEEEKEVAISLTEGSSSSEEVDKFEKGREKDAKERTSDEVLNEIRPLAGGTGKEVKKNDFPEVNAEAKDLLLSVKDIELLFIRVSESGAEVLRILETDTVNINLISADGTARMMNASTFISSLLFCCRNELPSVQERTESQSKLDLQKSASSLSSSSRSPMILGPSASVLLGECMNSGSHASTLDTLYAWERKLYDEVKANGVICRKYDAKCKLLKSQDLKGEKPIMVDKTRAGVKDLHSRICVAIHRIDSISKRIEEIRDKELQPQLDDLISALSRMWKTMLDCHKLQHGIIKKALCGGASSKRAPPQAELLRAAASTVQAELNRLCACFNKWVAALRCYLEGINNWALKCVKRVKQPRGRKDTVFPPRRASGPPIYVACSRWLAELEKLPVKETSESIKRMATEMGRIVPRDEKRKKKNDAVVDGGEGGPGREVVDWAPCLVVVQRGLVDLLWKLELFAEKSEGMYSRLVSEVEMARRKYEMQKAMADQRNS